MKDVRVTVRFDRATLDKLDRFAEAMHTTRSGVVRMLVEHFARVSGELVQMVQETSRGSEREALSEWIAEQVEDLERKRELVQRS